MLDNNSVSTSAPSSLSVVSLSKVIPFTGIPHAGGQYVLDHINHLSANANITIFAPAEDRNLFAVPKLYSGSFVAILVGSGFHRSRIGRFTLRLINRARRYFPMSSMPEFQTAIMLDRSLKEAIRKADVVEIQWAENTPLIRQIRRINPNSSIVVIAHDVLSQKYERLAASHVGFVRQSIANRVLRRLRNTEVKWLSRADRVIVFSNKDAKLLRSLGILSDIRVVQPPLATVHPHMVARAVPTGRNPTVLFTGAFSRPENEYGALWLLNSVWPVVIRKIPNAKLIIAGSNPGSNLLALADSRESVEITGYVESLDPYYAAADCFVAPIFSGAGVKFKVITAMSWGLPVVTTPTGAEGIGDGTHYAKITEDADEFSTAIIAILDDIDCYRPSADTTRQWVLEQYGELQFTNDLMAAYMF